MRSIMPVLFLMFLLLLPSLTEAQQSHPHETPYAAALSGWRAGRQYLFLTREDVPQGKTNALPRALRLEADLSAYFDSNHKAVVWADLNTNVIVLDTEDLRGYARILLVEGKEAGKIGWIARHFVHRSTRTLAGQVNTEKVNAAQKMVAYDAKDRRYYSVAYAQGHNMHDAGSDLLVVVPITLLPAEARLSRAMNGKLE